MGLDGMSPDGMSPDEMGMEPMGGLDGGNGMDANPDIDDMEDDEEKAPNQTNRDDDELMDIVNNLSVEDKAAVIKYARSMEGDSEEQENQDIDNDMPMESRARYRSVIDEVMNDVVNDRKGTKRPNKKLPRQYRDCEMPFKSPL